MEKQIAWTIFAAWALCASGAGSAPKWQPDWKTEKWDLRLTEPGAVRGMIGKTWCGHVQGMCATTNSFYFSFHNQILKTDWLGRMQRWVPVERHGGDICHWNGRLYVGVAHRPKEKGQKKCGKDGAVRFVYCTTANWMSQKENPLLPVQAVVQFADLKGGTFSDITRHIVFRKPMER